jgi:16S rRNA (guanine527-N7)-methyltransferase
MHDIGTGSGVGLDRFQALSLVPVSRETAERLALYVQMLTTWQQRTNLVSSATLNHVWTRHIADSAQLVDLAPSARIWLDIGSGAGFPGLVVAIMLASNPAAHVHCIEADVRKCAFLRTVARATGAPASIHNTRAERLTDLRLAAVDAVVSRAFASLPVVLSFAKDYLDQGAVGIFQRGSSPVAEKVHWLADQGFSAKIVPSVLDDQSKILIVKRSS